MPKKKEKAKKLAKEKGSAKKEESPKKPKPEKKKKLTKKQRKKLEAERAEQARRDEEQERIRLVAEEKARQEKLRIEAEERAKREVIEQAIRVVQLENTCNLLQSHFARNYELELETRRNEEWEQYVKCNGLPVPSNVCELNTYLHVWRLDEDLNKTEVVTQRTADALGLLSVLDDLIDDPLDAPERQVDNWKEVRTAIHDEQQHLLDYLIYWLLRRMEKALTRKGLNEMSYLHSCPHFILCLWCLMPLPRPESPPTGDDRPKKSCEFTKFNVSVQLPPSLGDTDLVIRGLWLNYDHLSTRCRTWDANPLPADQMTDLNTAMLAEWEEKCEHKEEYEADQLAQLGQKKKSEVQDPAASQDSSSRVLQQPGRLISGQSPPTTIAAVRSMSEQLAPPALSSKSTLNELGPPTLTDKSHSGVLAPPGHSERLASGQSATPALRPSQQPPPASPAYEMPPPPPRHASEIFSEMIEDHELQILSQLEMQDLDLEELNMRKYTVLGGTFYVDLLQQPPQPIELGERFFFTILQLPKKLKPIDFHEHYERPPPPPSPKTPPGSPHEAPAAQEPVAEEAVAEDVVAEEAEAEINIQDQKLNSLALVSIVLPQTVEWLELPTVVRWDGEKNFWSTEDIYDMQFDEDQQLLTFRTGMLGAFGLATYRYTNLPYKTWELKPDQRTAGVMLSITGVIFTINFLIKDGKVCITDRENSNQLPGLTDIMDKYYVPKKLCKLLCHRGLDLFPDHDAVCYVEGAAPKHRIAENHLYQCMALLSTTYKFLWSKWNMLAGRRNMVLQMMEYVPAIKTEENYSMLHVTPHRACIVDCTEESEAFTEDGVAGMKFYSDLYHLVLDHASFLSKKEISELESLMVMCVSNILMKTRPLSFS